MENGELLNVSGLHGARSVIAFHSFCHQLNWLFIGCAVCILCWTIVQQENNLQFLSKLICWMLNHNDDHHDFSEFVWFLNNLQTKHSDQHELTTSLNIKNKIKYVFMNSQPFAATSAIVETKKGNKMK